MPDPIEVPINAGDDWEPPGYQLPLTDDTDPVSSVHSHGDSPPLDEGDEQ